MESIPVDIIVNQEVGLLGAVQGAMRAPDLMEVEPPAAWVT